jgi:diguanylate cyclase
MFADITSMGSLLVLGTLFSVVTFVAGCAVGAWFLRAGATGFGAAPSGEADSQLMRSFERAMMASQRIHDLAKHVVSDVGDHGSKVEAFNTDLQTMSQDGSNVTADTLLLTIGQMTCANADLQQRLARLEKQIDSQAAELKNYGSEARTDSLTGLANRRAFDDELQRRFAEWQRRRTPFALMMLDIDNFKGINDSQGHQAGDEALRQLSNVITTNSRQMDFRGRYGGDEFIVILPDTGIQETRAAAERIRKAIAKTVFKYGTQTLSLTCSVGVARVTTQDDITRLIRRADEALYKSKEAGRDRGYWHDGKESLPLSADSPKGHGETAGNALDALADRTMFLDALKRRLPESQRFGIPLSIIHLGVANYKSLSESYGESAARSTLSAVASFTQAALRQIDLLARLDEGQFAILLPGSTSSEAKQIAKRLHMSAANCDARINNERIHLVVTHGIAEFRPNDTAEAMLVRAGEAAGTEKSAVDAVIA